MLCCLELCGVSGDLRRLVLVCAFGGLMEGLYGLVSAVALDAVLIGCIEWSQAVVDISVLKGVF